MGLEILAAIAVLAVIGMLGFVHVTGRAARADGADAGAALLEFGNAFPDEAIRAVVMTADRKTSFFRLADGRTGFLQALARHNVARLVEPGAVHVEMSGPGPALKIDFRETGISGGVYQFATAEDAAEVSLWLCGSFTLVDKAEAKSGTTPSAG